MYDEKVISYLKSKGFSYELACLLWDWSNTKSRVFKGAYSNESEVIDALDEEFKENKIWFKYGLKGEEWNE